MCKYIVYPVLLFSAVAVVWESSQFFTNVYFPITKAALTEIHPLAVQDIEEERSNNSLPAIPSDLTKRVVEANNNHSHIILEDIIISTVLGDHNPSIEHIPLQPWQINAIEQSRSGKIDAKCETPAPHISNDVCCGGYNQMKGRRPPVQFCRKHDVESYEKVRTIALRYMEGLPISRTTTVNNNRCDICQIIETMRKQNLSMILVGDSLTRQMTTGFVCALQARNYQVTIIPHENDRYALNMTVSSPNWNDTTKINNNITIVYQHEMFVPPAIIWERMFREMDIVVANFGVHYSIKSTRRGPLKYEKNLNETFASLKHLPRWPRLVAFRETAMQHFPSDSGEFFLMDKNKSQDSKRCSRLRASTYVGWREDTVNRLAAYHGIDTVSTNDENYGKSSNNKDKKTPQEQTVRHQITWLPFTNFTKDLHFIHSSGTENINDTSDCTHFCQSPYLWWPVLRSLRLAVDHTFNNNDNNSLIR